MADISKNTNTTGRRFLRPPSAVLVGRKSQSFNSADRNKIQKEPEAKSKMPSTISQPSALRAPATSSLSSVQSEWRSKSLNAKHSFTTRGISNSTAPSKLVKNSNSTIENKFKIRTSNSPTHLVKVESSSKATESSGKQRLIKMKTSSKSKETTSSLPSSSLSKSRSTRSESSMSKTKATESSSKLQLPSKTRPKTSGLVPPKSSVSRSASNSSRSSSVTAPSPDKKLKSKVKTGSKTGSKLSHTTTSKSSTSVLGRLRKLGSPPTTIPIDSNNGVTLKQALPVKSPKEEERPFITSTEQKSNLTHPSKLARGKTTAKSLAQPSNIGTKSSSGIKSTFQRAFGGAKEEKKVPVKMRQETGEKSQISQANSHSKTRAVAEEETEIIAITNSELSKRYSGEESIYRRDKIDVKDLKHLLVRPYDNARFKKEETRISSSIILTDEESNFSDDISQTSCDVAVKEFNRFTHEGQQRMEVENTNVQMSPRPNYESGVRNIQLPTSSDERKPHKTATVAPFRRQVMANGRIRVDPGQNTTENQQNEDSEEKTRPPSGSEVDEKTSIKSGEKILSPISVNTNVSMEVRRRTAKGIADLRQNLEETMCSLRNSQLKNRMSDEFERRISAQLDAEIDDIGLPVVPPPLSSNSSYRSTSSISGMHTISLGTRSPKLHAGECYATGSFTSPRPTKYSSLRRPLSGHTRVAWSDTPIIQPLEIMDIKHEDKQANLDDISSVSSEDISEYIAGVSTDDISLSSTNDSPYRCLKSLPATSNKQFSLPNPTAANISTESLEKSSSESNRFVAYYYHY